MSELYELPRGWEWRELEKLCNFTRGPFGGSLKKNIFKTSGFAVYEQSHAIYGKFDQIRYFIDDVKFQEMKRFTIKSDSLIMSCSGTIGKVMIVPIGIQEGIINQALLMLQPNQLLSNIFLKLLMESDFFQNLLIQNSTGAAISNIASVKILKQLKIPLPPLKEQKRIVAKLDKLFEKIDQAITLLQQNIETVNAFMPSVLDDVFGELEAKYALNNINKLCTKITDGTHSTPTYTKTGVHFLSVKDISKGVIDFSNTRYISAEEYSFLSKRCNVEKDDILYTKVGTTGIAKVVDTDIEFNIFVSIALLKPKFNLIRSMFFQHILNSPKCYQQAQSRTRGVANRNLVLKDIKQIHFPLPPLPIQQKVVHYLDQLTSKIEPIKQAQQDKLASLKALKASILDKAFRGEL